jgi:hypothetical protein
MMTSRNSNRDCRESEFLIKLEANPLYSQKELMPQNTKTVRTDAKILFAAITRPEVLYPARWKPASSKFVAWLKSHQVPEPIIELYKTGTPIEYAQLGWGGLSSEKEIIRNNERHPEFMDVGLLVVGSMSNGDYIVIDYDQGAGATGYFSHEILSAKPVPKGAQIRKDLRVISPSLGALVLGLVKDSLPGDYYWTWSEENETPHPTKRRK